MLRLNERLRALSHAISQRSNLQVNFTRLSHAELSELIREADPENRGYVLLSELLIPNKSQAKGMLAYLQSIFPGNISPSILASHLVQNSSSGSFTNIRQLDKLSLTHVREFLCFQFQAEQLKDEIRREAGKYIINEKGRISAKDFQNYISTQVLGINFCLVFDYLANGDNFIQIDENTGTRNMSSQIQDVRKKPEIERMDNLLSRLGTRVSNFGGEWLTK